MAIENRYGWHVTEENKPRKRPTAKGAPRRGRPARPVDERSARSGETRKPRRAGAATGRRGSQPSDERRPRRSSAKGEPQTKRTTRGGAPKAGSERTRTRKATQESPRGKQGQRPKNPQRAKGASQEQRPRLTAAQREVMRLRHAKRTILRRRLSIAGVLLFFIVGFIFVARYSLAKIDEHTTATDPAVDFTPVVCTPDMLDTTLYKNGDYAGQKVDVGVEVTNTGSDVPCYLEPADNPIRVEITSGDQTVFDSVQCSVPVVSQRLLLSPDLTTRPIVSWDGLNGGATCSGTTPATSGTYVARAYFDGEEMTEQGLVFELFDPPAEDDE